MVYHSFMDRIAPHLIGPIPTVLEIRGLAPETSRTVRAIFSDSLQQPSYVSRATILAGPSPRVVGRVELTCGLGLALEFSDYVYGNIGTYEVSQLSSCCAASMSGGTCSSCSSRTGYPLHHFVRPLAEQVEDEDGNITTERDNSMEKLDRELVEKLEETGGVDSMSAFLISQELCSLIREVARFNRDGS